MKDYIQQNKESWEFNVYDFWVKNAGTPEERAAKDIEAPIKMLKKYAAYFDSYEGVRVANICGSCGKKAIPLALLGAKVTVFDISSENRQYAMEQRQPHILPSILLWEMYWKSTWTGTAANLTWYSWKAESFTISMISVNLWMSCIPCSVPADA